MALIISKRLNFFKFGLFLLILTRPGHIQAQVLGPLPPAKHKFPVVAHRGDHTQAPENTLAAFENAIKMEPTT
jgi:glycerophosphoryl diester phosphodiesterase